MDPLRDVVGTRKRLVWLHDTLNDAKGHAAIVMKRQQASKFGRMP